MNIHQSLLSRCFLGLLCIGVNRIAQAQVAPLPRWWGGVSAGIGVAGVPTGGRDTAYRGGPLATFRLDVGMRIAKQFGITLEGSHIVNGQPEGCDVVLPSPNCAPGIEYSSLAGSIAYAGGTGPLFGAGLGAYRLKPGWTNPATTVLALHAGAEVPVLHGKGGGLTAGLRGTLLPNPPGRWIGAVSFYIAARGWTYTR